MFSRLLICACLVPGQIADAPDEIAAPPAVSLPDRWLLMKVLQGTWYGAALDSQRTQISGWTDASFTASSDRITNFPQGFNDRANELLLEQNWLRLDRSVLTSGIEPTFGFRSDWILGSDYRYTLPRGLFNSQLTAAQGQPDLYGVDPVQFYAEAYFPTINPRLRYALETTLGFTANVPAIGTAYWAAAVNYLTFDFSSRLSGTIRTEFFDDVQGQRTGFPGLYTGVTTGLNFRWRRDIVIRPELRWNNNAESAAFENHHDLFTAACDVIFRW